MSRPASYYVAAQERYCSALERVLGLTTEALEHYRSCITCRSLGYGCDIGEDIEKRRLKAVLSMEAELRELQYKEADVSKLYTLAQHVAEDNRSPYQDYACKILREIKEGPYGRRTGRKYPK